MENFIINLLTQNSWLIWAILALVLMLVAIALIQGRKINIAGFELGPRETKDHQAGSPISLINNIYAGTPEKLSEDDYEKIYLRVTKRWEVEHQKEKANSKKRIFSPPEVSEETIELFKIQLAIENKIREVVVTEWGHWAGHSLAPASTFLSLGFTNGLISEELLEEIGNFYAELTPGIYGSPIPKDFVDRVEVIAVDIMRQLDKIVEETRKS